MEKKLETIFKEAGAYSVYTNETIDSITQQLESNGKAVFEINLETLDLIELIEYNSNLDVNYILLYPEENLYQITLYN